MAFCQHTPSDSICWCTGHQQFPFSYLVDGSIDVVIGSAPEPAVVVALHGECVSKVGFNQRIEGKYGAPTGTESMCSCHSGFCVMNRLQDCGTCNAARVEQLKSPSRLARGERLTRLELIEVISTSTRQTLLASRVSTVVSPKLDSSLAMGSAWAENTLDNCDCNDRKTSATKVRVNERGITGADKARGEGGRRSANIGAREGLR